MKGKFNLEKPEVVFIYVPEIEDICIEFGIDKNDAETITCMYEVFKRISGGETKAVRDESYDDGYRDGYNAALDDVDGEITNFEWEVERLRKNR